MPFSSAPQGTEDEAARADRPVTRALTGSRVGILVAVPEDADGDKDTDIGAVASGHVLIHDEN